MLPEREMVFFPGISTSRNSATSATQKPPERFVIMRHDRKPGDALSTARIEAVSGIKGGMSISSYKIYSSVLS